MHKTTRRRSRMQRQPSGKAIAISPRDLSIFEMLRSYRYLPSTYIHAFVGGASETRFKERLGDLFHEGYLDRPNQQWQLADARCRPVVHETGDGARRALAMLSRDAAGERTYLGVGAHRQFIHSLLICEVLASIELGTRAKPGLRFIAWSEILARAPGETRRSPRPFAIPVPGSTTAIVPDAVFGLEYLAHGRKAYRFFALEIDRGTMPVVRSDRTQTSFAAKLGSYRRLISGGGHKSHLGISTLFVLTLTTRAAHMREIMRCIEEGDAASPALLFNALSGSAPCGGIARPVLGLIGEPWHRVGHPVLDLAAP